MGCEQRGEEGVEFIGSAIDGASHPEAVGNIHLVPVVTGLLKTVSVRTEGFLQEFARVFFSIKKIKIPSLNLLQALRLGSKVLVRDKKSTCGSPQMFVIYRLQFLA